MTDYRDMEHDTIADAPDVVGKAPELGPEPTERQMQREDMLEALAERRRAEAAKAITERYRIIEYPEGTEAENETWLSYDNPAIWTRLGQR